MYDWRKLTHEIRSEILRSRKERQFSWHNPPHQNRGENNYHLTGACYEHRPIIGCSPTRMSDFKHQLLATIASHADRIHAWCILPNHYHLLFFSENIMAAMKTIGRLHGKTAYLWNGEDGQRGRKVWFNCVDRVIRSERHFWATMNYIHHQPVHHGYTEKWFQWPFSSAEQFLKETGEREAKRIWNEYPILEYGKEWDPPSR